MITKIINVTTEYDKCPSDEDILECIELAKLENCIVKLHWTLHWSGEYYRYVYQSSTLESVKNSLPTLYGM